MRLMTGIRLLAVGLALVGAVGVAPASAAQPCVRAVVGDERLRTGIATAEPDREVRVLTCDGRWMRVAALPPSGAVLAPAPTPARRPPKATAEPLGDTDVTGPFGPVEAAWMVTPTDAYDHGILGDAIEAKGFAVRRSDGETVTYALSGPGVFEDRRVRLADLTGDGRPEGIVVRSGEGAGASLDVYALVGDDIARIAASSPIGLSHRWLNPVGAADFDGDGAVEVALVETPHIGGTLRIFGLCGGLSGGLSGDRLVEEASLFGFSNHAIGARLLDLAAVIDWDRDGLPDLAVPDRSRSALVFLSLADGHLVERARFAHDQEIATGILAADLEGTGSVHVLYGLRDGTLVVHRRP